MLPSCLGPCGQTVHEGIVGAAGSTRIHGRSIPRAQHTVNKTAGFSRTDVRSRPTVAAHSRPDHLPSGQDLLPLERLSGRKLGPLWTLCISLQPNCRCNDSTSTCNRAPRSIATLSSPARPHRHPRCLAPTALANDETVSASAPTPSPTSTSDSSYSRGPPSSASSSSSSSSAAPPFPGSPSTRHPGGAPAVSPLSPATARALARVFLAGDLSLASAEPLQVWCGRPTERPSQQGPSAAQQQLQPTRQGTQPTKGGQLARRFTPSRAAPRKPPPPTHLQLQPAPGGYYGEGGAGGNGSRGSVGARTEGGWQSVTGGGADMGHADVAVTDVRQGDVDVLLVGPAGLPRDVTMLTAAVERVLAQPAPRGCVGCVVVVPSRERAEALQEAAFLLLTEREAQGDWLRVMAVHGGTQFEDDVAGLRARPPDLLVGTLGRLVGLLGSPLLSVGHLFESVRVLAVDGGEALTDVNNRLQLEALLRLLPTTSIRRGNAAAAAGTGLASPAAAFAFPASPPLVAAAAAAGSQPPAVTLLAAAIIMQSRPPAKPPAPRRPLSHAAGTTLTGVSSEASARHAFAQTKAPAEAAKAMAAAATAPAAMPPALRALVDAALRDGYVTCSLGGSKAACGGSAAEGGRGGGVDDWGVRVSLAAAVTATLETHRSAGADRACVPRAASIPSQRASLPYDLVQRDGSPSTGGLAAELDASPPALSRATATTAPNATAGAAIAVAATTTTAATQATTATTSVPLHVLPVLYEQHLPFLYVVLRQHMLSEPRHKIVVQFPSAFVAALYAKLFQALGFPVTEAHSRTSPDPRQNAVRDFAAGQRGLLFSTDLGGSAGLDPRVGLTLVIWVGLPRLPKLLVQQLSTLQQAAHAAAASSGPLPPWALAGASQDESPLPGAAVAPPQHPSHRPASSNGGQGGPAPMGAPILATPGQEHQQHQQRAQRPDEGARARPEAEMPSPNGQRTRRQGRAKRPAGSAPGAVGPVFAQPSCLLLLNDVEPAAAAAAVAAVAEALAREGVGHVVPVRPGPWAGPLDAVQDRVVQALEKVDQAYKLKGLGGAMGHLWATYGSGGDAATTGGSDHGADAWRHGGAPLIVLQAAKMADWARRFAIVMGMPQPQLSRKAAASMGLLNTPGIAVVDTEAQAEHQYRQQQERVQMKRQQHGQPRRIRRSGLWSHWRLQRKRQQPQPSAGEAVVGNLQVSAELGGGGVNSAPTAGEDGAL